MVRQCATVYLTSHMELRVRIDLGMSVSSLKAGVVVRSIYDFCRVYVGRISQVQVLQSTGLQDTVQVNETDSCTV